MKLSGDVSRCSGTILVSSVSVECPQREQCKRFKCPPVGDWQSYVLIEGEHQIGNCNYIIRTEVDRRQ